MQYGFRKTFSTELAILELQDRIINALDQKLCCAGIFMDLSKAFDTLDHQILLTKLNHYGIRGITLDWFRNYLTNRTQYVCLNDSSSEPDTLICGVPQGSILGPLLFLIYINDLPLATKLSSPILFADDTNLIYTAVTYNELNKKINDDIKVVSDWFMYNKLALNESKTKYIIFHKRLNKPPDNFDIQINDKTIERVDSTKFLGVIIQENMAWDKHINFIGTKINKICALLSRLKYQIPTYILSIIYNTLLAPHISYGITVWGSSPISHLKRLIILQKKALRHVTKAKYNSHSEPIFKSLNYLKLTDIYKVSCCKLAHKKKLNKLHEYHADKIIFNYEKESVRTRQAFDITVSRKKNNTLNHCLNEKISAVWNELPNEFKNLTVSEHTFGKTLKKHYIKQYNDSCLIEECYVCEIGKH